MREDELKNNYSENWIQDEISEGGRTIRVIKAEI
jgi:hypothetical protein